MFAEASVKQLPNGQYGVSYGDDNGIFAEFYKGAIPDDAKTVEMGRPIYRSVDMITMRFPGNNTKVIDRPVRFEQEGREPPDTLRFPRQWDAYQNQEKQVQDGTPIDQWPPLNKAQVMDLKGLNIHTVEQLAAVTDNNLWMGGRQLRDNAIAWLEEAESGAGVAMLMKKVEDLELQLQAATNTINAMGPKPEASEIQHQDSVAVSDYVDQDVKPIVGKMRKKPGRKPKGAENGTDTIAASAASGE